MTAVIDEERVAWDLLESLDHGQKCEVAIAWRWTIERGRRRQRKTCGRRGEWVGTFPCCDERLVVCNKHHKIKHTEHWYCLGCNTMFPDLTWVKL